jgi:hypothetical protein
MRSWIRVWAGVNGADVLVFLLPVLHDLFALMGIELALGETDSVDRQQGDCAHKCYAKKVACLKGLYLKEGRAES